jgi:hypothetical protein
VSCGVWKNPRQVTPEALLQALALKQEPARLAG